LAGLLSRDANATAPAQRLRLNGNVLAACYLLLAMAMIGLPPLAGFLGKLLILDAARADSQVVIIWTAILVTSLILLVSFARTGIRMFWTGPEGKTPEIRSVPKRAFQMMMVLIAVVAALSLMAGPVMTNMAATAEQLMAPKTYIGSVLKSPAPPQGGG